MAAKKLDFTTPVVRIVSGSVYEPKTTDMDGNPLVVKTGPNIGQPRKEWSFALAFPKNPGETHWSQNPFFAPIWAYGHNAFPNGQANHPTFAWKIQDGDSTIPNKKGKKNCDKPGHAGHWIMWLSSGQAPQFWDAKGTQQIPGESIKTGYFVQVFGNVSDNTPSPSPGLYVNHSMVALAGFGEEIISGPDVSVAGFGQNTQLPPGASAAPLAAFVPPSAPGAVPPPPGVVAPPPAPPAAGRVMLPAANGATYEQLVAQGWTEALLIQHGMMAAPVAAPPLSPAGSVPPPPVPAPTVVAPPPLAVIPNPAILAVPGGAVIPPPPAAGRVMLPGAPGAYVDMIAAGWTDQTLVQHGYMAP